MALAAIGGGGLANWALRNRAADLQNAPADEMRNFRAGIREQYQNLLQDGNDIV
jgi:hypothetical protein